MLTLRFAFERDTKNTRRYQELTVDGERGAVGTLYVTQETLRKVFGDLPEMLTVTIEEETDDSSEDR